MKVKRGNWEEQRVVTVVLLRYSKRPEKRGQERTGEMIC